MADEYKNLSNRVLKHVGYELDCIFDDLIDLMFSIGKSEYYDTEVVQAGKALELKTGKLLLYLDSMRNLHRDLEFGGSE